MTLSATLTASITGSLTSATDLATAVATLSYGKQTPFTDGAGAGAVNALFADTRTVNASATDSLDLAGTLTNPLGATTVFARVKAILIVAAAGNTNNVNVTRPASNGFPLFLAAGDGIPVRPGGTFLWVDPSATGIAVTAGTGDLLDIVNSGGGSSVDYSIWIFGATS